MSETATRPLFRPQAVQAHQGRMWTGHTLRPPVSMTILTVALLAAVGAIGVFLGTQTYARKATASGYLTPLHGVVRVMPPRAGVIVNVAVADGDTVRAGDPLLRVEASRMSAGGFDIDADVRKALIQQRDFQVSQIEQEATTARSEAQRMTQRIARLEDECGMISQQIAVQRGRVGLANEQASMSRGLAAEGYLSGVEQRRREDALMGQAQSLEQMRQQLSAKQGELVELRFSLAQLPGRSADRLASLRAALAAIDSRLAEAEGQRAYLVVAPASGRVSAVQVTPGNQADPGRPLLSIVPEDDPLQAVLFVPERAIGFVAPGQDVRLSLDAFPFQRFGAQHGTITTVARTILKPDQLNASVTAPAEPSYRVTVTLKSQTIMAYGKPVPLQADMVLRADIIFDRRSFLQWLLDPILSARGRA